MLSLHAEAQSVAGIAELLQSGKFQSFKTYVDSAGKTDVSFDWLALREVVAGYWEGVLEIQEFRDANNGTGGSIIYNYRIEFLSTDETIFFYRFKKGDSIIRIFSDAGLYKRFESTFAETYNAKLNPKELFVTSIIYGGSCGIAGTPPEYQQKLRNALSNMNVKTLHAWLTSANSEKQLYAVLGFKVLEKNGYELKNDDKRIISIIKQKQGKVSTCGGCMFYSDEIRNVIAGINSPTANFTFPTPRKNDKAGYYALGVILLVVVALRIYLRTRLKQYG